MGVDNAWRASPSERAGAPRLVLTPSPDRERAFAKARRHTARVRFLRAAILVGGLGSAAAMIGIAIFNPFATKFGALSFSNLSVDGTKITMVRPKLAGFRSDGQPYDLTAERALQDIANPTVLELVKLDGEIGKTQGESTHLSADAGVYDSVRERMKLTKNVRIGNARFDVRLRSAEIDFKTGVYKSNEPVEVHVGDGTTITCDRAAARNNGQELTFEGHVRTKIIPYAEAPPGADANRNDR